MTPAAITEWMQVALMGALVALVWLLVVAAATVGLLELLRVRRGETREEEV